MTLHGIWSYGIDEYVIEKLIGQRIIRRHVDEFSCFSNRILVGILEEFCSHLQNSDQRSPNTPNKYESYQNFADDGGIL
jgi:hypothetical protein